LQKQNCKRSDDAAERAKEADVIQVIEGARVHVSIS
jgi:hypothetical protein